MDMQFGFDFEVDLSTAFREYARGTYDFPQRTMTEFLHTLDCADALLLRIAGPARGLFRLGVEAARADLDRRYAFEKSSDRPFSYFGADVDVSDDLIALFMAHCDSMASLTFYGIEYKVSKSFDTTTAMHIENVGTLIARKHHRSERCGQYSLSFTPCRHTFLLPGYGDNAPVFHVQERIWRRSYCADKLAESGKKVASVPQFAYNGRYYIVTMGSYSGTDSLGGAWRLCAVEDWKGPTYTYESHGVAMNSGMVDRGDYRGFVVSVKGKRYVVESAAYFYSKEVDQIPLDEYLDSADEADEE